MAKPRHEKKRPKAKPVQPSLPRMPTPDPPGTAPILPMLLRIGDRLTDETGEYVIAGLSHTTNAGKEVHARVRRVDNVEVTMTRTWAAHERISVKRAEEGK
jgi:hypothetical protein